jgi:pyruvate,water dikinase
MRSDIENASREILDSLDGEAFHEMRAANAVNLRMAPLTPDHHFYIDQGANAHVRLVLLAVGGKLVDAGRIDQPDDVMFLRYNELRMLVGSADAIDARALVATRRAERDAARKLQPRDWVGTVTPSQLAFPYLVNWGYPERFHREQSEDERLISGIAGSPGTIEGIARVVMTVDEFDQVRDGDILVCQMTNPAWVVLFTKIAGLVTDTGGTTSHPAVLSREFGIPAVIGTSVATKRIRTGDRIRVDGTKGSVEILPATTSEPAQAGETAAIGS